MPRTSIENTLTSVVIPTGYVNLSSISKLTSSLDVSRFFPLLPDVFHLNGHVLGTNKR